MDSKTAHQWLKVLSESVITIISYLHCIRVDYSTEYITVFENSNGQLDRFFLFTLSVESQFIYSYNSIPRNVNLLTEKFSYCLNNSLGATAYRTY